ncbi:hypothetical protein BC941DRAFT_475034 [Chlamydoabsidia padenii]|nr:hypothetical protein BC941DRAFT_475034 [Chlamydoabsidia padenii]
MKTVLLASVFCLLIAMVTAGADSTLNHDKDCIAKTNPKSHPECIGGTVSMTDVVTQGTFCYCGCNKVYGLALKANRCFYALANYQKPDYKPGESEVGSGNLGSMIANLFYKIPVGEIQKIGSGASDAVGAFEYYKAMNKDATIDQFMASEFNPCPRMLQEAKDVCSKCPVCSLS